jgi:hypothetical protein
VVGEAGLDLAGADLEAAALDEVGGAAADDAQGAGGVAGGEVAGVEPAVLVAYGGGGGRVVEIVLEELGAADGDLADALIVVGAEGAALVVAEAELDAGQRGADAARLRRAGDGHGAVDQGLGEAVALVHAAAGEGAEAMVLAQGGGRRSRR